MRVTPKYLAPALVAAAATAITLAGCAPTTAGGGGDADEADAAPVAIGMITSQTGPLAAYGEAYTAGFEAGLDYATEGTGEVDGRELDITWEDDQGNPDTAVAKAKDLIGQGTKVLAGTVVSGIATSLAEQAAQNEILYISGPAATDAITGVNDYTFRSGRQTYQDVATAGTFIGDPEGKKVVVFAQDTAFGQGNLAGVQAVLGGQGATVEGVLVAEDATEFTPFAQQLVSAQPDLIFVAWAGASSGAMWTALEQQGVFDAAPVVTGLGDVATYQAYGDASGNISFLNHYFGGAGGTDVEEAMIAHLEENGAEPDLFSVDGFVAAQMIVQAVREGGDDVESMIDALEGWSFESVKGEVTVRAEDHALIQPMYQVSLVEGDAGWEPELVETIDAETVAPPVVD
ncbi:branched-chain amino acid transport system substrate-binding protein [Agromyces flavus]|uniref:Amino acid/amide ABC transporter substrate-binding protein, HAAT family n=1 Tax=Agromyces flavus TaxID=589382 RepID=A0A1H1TUB8_9MICO|nr:substrate-binding domain-containing protein [Agromyces flavus]MCP2368366.1 branched-chain amino acid transport system substrate-binding protein [Agromyces flavus]GGI47827.1 ABC transporter substrate-binding protein [Agromyces flavus]SDS63209.1 amino acid/amide ABC transporter substrate-binding protein, HAAT family [Agromyces flavus]